MVITHFKSPETHEKSSLNNRSNKAKLRRQRYEDTTLNKPCTVRAHPDTHQLIKKYAKTGKCDNCRALILKCKEIKATLDLQVKEPVRWNDELTRRDAILSTYVVIFTLTFVVIYEMAKRLTF